MDCDKESRVNACKALEMAQSQCPHMLTLTINYFYNSRLTPFFLSGGIIKTNN